ncbi:sodium-extruding oxaloacetate decarboxylase subunit alpha [methanotrophic endosymbiont of Bathymodiolus puteoserpentis (Logatchev)]|jgi:pyruvate carboxylase subunit B|uniref:sodium-extruding oxaloacetate decarboxylase subunit alpha n=1 Tax=methanotrophic endosymbiont of Bathymodiolus puteoserpentis (Logatchev) TaxID=343235 RepID=UPI0013C7FF48|nr:sodium-extruding oxaloacetate decarboxylase subunit alpha [methanotrophic endosymbiont of Bathymodiolus puteoserpentis (Logatchev)]SHE23077.1 Pyruvate carboxylase subunit B (biotin-containing) [methanotrophic endosymbiont of Bathymodiolus puteoserpentis (Logatchev)]
MSIQNISTKGSVYFTDVVLRDGHQSLIATRLRTEDMLPICEKLDRAGYWSLEVWGGATFDACLRFLKEDPWERLRQLRLALPNTRLQMLLRGQNLLGYRHYADDVVNAFIDKSAENGIDVFRLFDALNDERNLITAVNAVKRNQKHAQGTLCYTVSPVHTLDSFVELAVKLEDMGCDSLAIKDMAGLLTPFSAEQLVSRLKERVDLPLFLHSHSTSGMSTMCQLKAVEAGCQHIDTAISSFAGGTSHPPTETMAVALREAGYEVDLDMALLKEIADYFKEVRKKYHQFESAYSGVDTDVLLSQVPGGMMSNLANQLKEQGALERIDEVFAEIPKVRKDLGYPPLVTPTSQIVGTQAVLNVVTGERYKSITNEVKRYLQGGYGRAPGNVDTGLRKQAIGNETVIDVRPADLIKDEMASLRKESTAFAKNEEDVLIFAMFPDIGQTYLEQRELGTLEPEVLQAQGQATAGSSVPLATEFNISLHGETYNIQLTGAGPHEQNQRHLYLTVDGMPEEVLLQSLNEYSGQNQLGRPTSRGPGDISTSMPGNVVDVMVNEGDQVAIGDTLFIIEAMKMETEIKAQVSGRVANVHIKKGDRVTPGEALIQIEI